MLLWKFCNSHKNKINKYSVIPFVNAKFFVVFFPNNIFNKRKSIPIYLVAQKNNSACLSKCD